MGPNATPQRATVLSHSSNSLRCFRQLLPQPCTHHHPTLKAIETELFIWRMRIVVRQGQSKQQGVSAQNLFEISHDRNRAAFPQ